MPTVLPHGVTENAPLAPRLTLGTGGLARYFATASDEAVLRSLLRWAGRERLEVLILGGGSNLVCADAGFDGLVIQIALRGIETKSDGSSVLLRAGAGERWDAVVAHAVGAGCAGIECLSGIPGLVGATPIQNVGAYGQEVKSTITEVRCLSHDDLAIQTFSNRECDFRYRDSRFKRDDDARFVVLAVTFRLTPGGAPTLAYGDIAARAGSAPTLARVRQAVLEARREKSMLLDPGDPNGRSCGSFFLNPIVPRERFEALAREHGEVPHYPEPDGRVKLPAAWLIEQAGFRKGERAGNVGLSTRHALAIVAHDGATAHAVRSFAVAVKEAVHARFGVALQAEPRFVGFSAP